MSENDINSTAESKPTEIEVSIEHQIAEFKRDLHKYSKNQLIKAVIELFIKNIQLSTVGEQLGNEFNKYAQEHRTCPVTLKKIEEYELNNKSENKEEVKND